MKDRVQELKDRSNGVSDYEITYENAYFTQVGLDFVIRSWLYIFLLRPFIVLCPFCFSFNSLSSFLHFFIPSTTSFRPLPLCQTPECLLVQVQHAVVATQFTDSEGREQLAASHPEMNGSLANDEGDIIKEFSSDEGKPDEVIRSFF